jgi:hypothetical protein
MQFFGADFVAAIVIDIHSDPGMSKKVDGPI